MTPARPYPDTRAGAIACLRASCAIDPADLATARVTPDPWVVGCWLVECEAPSLGGGAHAFIVYTTDHHDPHVRGTWEEVQTA